MASVAYRAGGNRMATGGLDYDTDVIKATLVMTSFVEGVDDATLSAITMDECDSATFTFAHAGNGRLTLSGRAVSTSTATRVDFEAGSASTTWASLAIGASARSIQGALIHEPGATNDTDAYPIAYTDFGTAVAANGQDFIVNWDSGNTEDIMRWTFL